MSRVVEATLTGALLLSTAAVLPVTGQQAQQDRQEAQPGPPAHDAEAHERFRRAQQALEAGRLEGLVELLRPALEADPHHPRPWFWLGAVLQLEGALREAAGAFERALELDPDLLPARYNLGSVLFRLGRPLSAAAAFHRVVQDQPGDGEAWYNLGIALLRGGRPAEAVQPLQRADELRPDWPEALHGLAAALLESGRPDDAARIVQRALQLRPGDPGLRVTEAEILGADDPDAARRRLEQLLQEHPDLVDAWRALGVLRAEAPDRDVRARATAALRRALRIDPDDPAVWFALKDAYRALGLSEETEATLHDIVERFPDSPRAWLELGTYQAARGRSDLALRAFERVVELAPEMAQGHFGRAVALEELRRFHDAVEAYGRTLELQPGFTLAAVGLARAALAVGEPDRAVAALQGVPESQRTPTALRLLGRALLQSGRPDAAAAVLRQAVRAEPEAAEARDAWVSLAQALEATGDPGAAEALATARRLAAQESRQRTEEIADNVERRGERLLTRADVLLHEGRLREARQALRQAAQFRDPGDPRIAALRRRLERAGDVADVGPEAPGPGAEVEPETDPPPRPADTGTGETETEAEEPAPPTAATPGVTPSLGPFFDVAPDLGLDAVNHSGTPSKEFIVESTGSGAAWLDFDRDGRVDLHLADGAVARYVTLEDGGTGIEVVEAPPDSLFRQGRAGAFVDVAGRAGVADRGWAGGAAFADVDNDGWPDLYLTHNGSNRLYRNNGDGTFSDVTAGAGADDVRWSTTAAFADLDGNGFVDLYVANYVTFEPLSPPFAGKSLCRYMGIPVMCGPTGMPGQGDRLLWNRGDLTFEAVEQDDGGYYGLGVMPLDVDADGRLDLYVANDMTPNVLLRNRGERRLSEEGLLYGVAYSGDGRLQAGMGIAVGDVGDDGDEDIVVTNFSHDSNTLYENAGGAPLTDASERLGLAAPTYDYLGWGTQLRDLDLDGDLDLFFANGHVYPAVSEHDIGTGYRQRNQLFAATDGRFVEVTDAAGPALQQLRSSRAAVAADYDFDGDEDLLVTNIDAPAALLRNERRGGSWLQVQLVGREGPRDGIGTRVTVRSGDRVQRRTMQTAAGYLGANEAVLTFGLGGGGTAELEVAWSSGTVDRIEALSAGARVLVVEGRGVVAVRRPPGAQGAASR